MVVEEVVAAEVLVVMVPAPCKSHSPRNRSVGSLACDSDGRSDQIRTLELRCPHTVQAGKAGEGLGAQHLHLCMAAFAVVADRM